MANELSRPTVLLAHFPHENEQPFPVDERQLITQALSEGIEEGDTLLFDAGELHQGHIPVVTHELFSADHVRVVHLIGRPFGAEEAAISPQQQQRQTDVLRHVSDSILRFPNLQLVVLSGTENEELVRQLLLLGIPTVLSIAHSANHPDQVEALYMGLAKRQSIRQTLEFLAETYPAWELHLQEIQYNPENESLHWDAHLMPKGPNWRHGLIYRESNWRSLTWRLRNPLVNPLRERRGASVQSQSASDILSQRTDPTTNKSPEDDAPKRRSRALQRGVEKAREMRAREQKHKAKKQRRRKLLITVGAVVAVIALAIPAWIYVTPLTSTAQTTSKGTLPCPFPEETEAYRVLILPFKQTPECLGGAASYYSDQLLDKVRALRQGGFRIEVRYQEIDDCPITEETVQQTANLCNSDLVVWGTYNRDSTTGKSRILTGYFTQNRAGEQLFLKQSDVQQEITGGNLPFADSILRQDLGNLVLWAAANQHMAHEEYDMAIKAYLSVSPQKDEFRFMLTQRLTEAYVQAGRYEQARQYFGQLIHMHPNDPSYYLDRANMLALMNEPEDALLDLDKVMELAPENISAIVRRAEVHAQLEKYPEALADIDRALSLSPDQAGLYSKRGDILRYQDQFTEAQTAYERAINLSPNAAEAYYGMGLIWQAKGEDQRALKAIDQALRYDPELLGAGLFRGDVLSDQALWAQAIEAYTGVLKRQVSPEAYTRRGYAYEKENRLAEALADYRAATGLAQTYTPAWMGRARIYSATQRVELAMEDLTRVLQQQPSHTAALRLRAEIHLMRKEWEEATADLTLLRQHIDPDTQVYYYQATALLERDRPEQAATMADSASALGASSNQLKLLRGRIDLARKQPESALAVLNDVLAAKPEWGEAYHFRGMAYLQLGRDEEARADLEASASRGTSKEDTYLRLGDLYRRAGRLADAKQAYNQVIRSQPDQAPAYLGRAEVYRDLHLYDSSLLDYNQGLLLDPQAGIQPLIDRGQVKTKLGQYNQALVDYNQVLRQRANDPIAYRLRGQLYQRMGLANKAEIDLKQAVRLSPRSAEPLYYLAEVYIERDELDLASQTLGQALQLDPGYAAAYNLRGEIRIEKEEYEGAISDFNQSLTLDPTQADAYDNLGDFLRRGGEYQRALDNYSQAISYDPRHADALYYRGFIRSLRGDYEQAIADIEFSLDIKPGMSLRYGYLAQIYAKMQVEDTFFHYLQLAVDNGYPIYELESDPAFRGYRDHLKFQQMLKSYE